ncbi:MAG TPA: hypothetical protein PLI48_06075 [Gammaproteobacteria bacterium]|nr:hypothetical protein [Gammaproteobacteria bacterium]
MLIRTLARMAAIPALALVPTVLLAALAPPQPEFGPIVEFDGRHYQVVRSDGIDWDAANDIANASVYDGVSGHLATLTSRAEDEFVDQLRRDSGLARPEVWVGGVQQSCTPEAAGCGWHWVNGEAAISTPQAPLLSYSNWLPGEPNDNYGKGSEQHLAIGLGNAFGWNDEGALGNIGGFVIEYDTARIVDPNQCIEGDGCETTAGQVLLLPPVELADNASIGIRTYEFTDDPDRCGVAPLTLFGGSDPRPPLVIPPYLCGSPRFLVVEVSTEGFEVRQGTILVENEPAEALPGNLYECTGPIAQDPLNPDLDPQHRDVVAWQATAAADMLESDLGASVDPMFAGALGEFTFECGSSRGKIKSASYYVVGMHIDFGEGYDLAGNAAANHERFVALTRYKLQLLQAAVEESRTNLALQNGDYTKMSTMLRNALRFHDRGQFGSALKSVNQFLKFVDKADYAVIPGENYQGEHDMRGSNLVFMYEEKVIPFAP